MTNEEIRQKWRNERALEEVHREWHKHMDADKQPPIPPDAARSHLVRDGRTLCGLTEWAAGNADIKFGIEKGITTCVGCLRAAYMEKSALPEAPAGATADRALSAFDDVMAGCSGFGREERREAMTAAVAVVLADRGLVEWERVEKAINDEGERISWQGFGAETTFAKAVRKRLTEQEPVERVTISDGDCADLVCVLLDGKVQISQLKRVYAEIYAAGLRLKLEQQSQEGARSDR